MSLLLKGSSRPRQCKNEGQDTPLCHQIIALFMFNHEHIPALFGCHLFQWSNYRHIVAREVLVYQIPNMRGSEIQDLAIKRTPVCRQVIAWLCLCCENVVQYVHSKLQKASWCIFSTKRGPNRLGYALQVRLACILHLHCFSASIWFICGFAEQEAPMRFVCEVAAAINATIRGPFMAKSPAMCHYKSFNRISDYKRQANLWSFL